MAKKHQISSSRKSTRTAAQRSWRRKDRLRIAGIAPHPNRRVKVLRRADRGRGVYETAGCASFGVRHEIPLPEEEV